MFVATGNRLLDGIVVFLTDNGTWAEDLQDACLFVDEGAAQTAIEETDQDVVSLDIVPADKDEKGVIVPDRLRERIRALGPTINPFDSIRLADRHDAAIAE